MQHSLLKRSQIETLGEYQLSTFLGNGGSSQVYRAWQPKLAREVAIKLLLPNFTTDPRYLERFHREARLVAGLQHLHIVSVFDYGVVDDIAYLVMPLLLGGTLVDRVLRRQVKAMPLIAMADIATFLLDISDALDYAHSRGVVHCDIKPANILFDERGAAYLADFGIAAILGAQTGERRQTDFVTGSIAYMAPELWRSEPPSPVVDQYALGLVIYALITGQPPFTVEWSNPTEVMQRHMAEMPIPLHVVRKEVSPDISAVIERAIAKEPRKRYETIAAFASDFKAAVERDSRNFDNMPATSDPNTNWAAAPTRMARTAPTRVTRTSLAEQPSRTEKIFISYRHLENTGMVDLIYRSLIDAFTAPFVFRDQESIPLGTNFKTYLDNVIRQCRVVVVIIGPQWLLHLDSNGRRRIDNPNDFVRVEVQAALQRDIPIIPVFIDGATMPTAEELPKELQELVYLNGLPVRSGADAANDIAKLIVAVRYLAIQ